MVNSPQEHRFTVGGNNSVDLQVEVWPQQAPSHPVGFVLVHGLASNAAMWRAVAERLHSLGHAAAYFDQRGHGRSSKPGSGYDLATFVSDLTELLGRLPLRRPVLVGQSFGGNVVVDLAARHPELVSGVACIDGGWIELSEHFSSWDACHSELAPLVLEGRSIEELRSLLASRHAGWPEPAIDGFLGNFEVRHDGTVAPWLTRQRHLQLLRSLWEHHPSRLYQSVRVPVLLVPAVDPAQPKVWDETIDIAVARLPVSRLHPMTGDHDLHAQHPEAVADLLHEWADATIARSSGPADA